MIDGQRERAQGLDKETRERKEEDKQEMERTRKKR